MTPDMHKFIKIIWNKTVPRKYSRFKFVNIAITLFNLELGGGEERKLEKSQVKTFVRNKEQLKECL